MRSVAGSSRTPTATPLAVLLLAVLSTLAGCGTGMEALMPTPAVFTETGLEPLAHIPPDERWTPRRVYYVTTRERDRNLQRIDYTNTPSDKTSMGMALIEFGGPTFSWEDLNQASTTTEREHVVKLSTAGILEAGRFPAASSPDQVARPDRAGWLVRELNESIETSRDKDILIYVHGAKVNFYNACAFAAQLDHFMGRDMTSMAFSWPTRQNILAYGLGSDVDRAYASAPRLASMIETLASQTSARRIHVLCWSAGARLTTAALTELRARSPDDSLDEVRRRLRIGTVYFAAADVPTAEFVEALPTIHGISGRIVATVSSNDSALIYASRFMGGGGRIGQAGNTFTDEQRAMIESLERLEIIDLSRNSESRGFDITGHNYWFDHPWASSDALLSIRTDFPPLERGLSQGDSPVHWYMPADYIERLRASLEDARFLRWTDDG